MIDENIVHLCGLIGDDYKDGKTSEGKEFITFSLCISTYVKDYADSTEKNHSQTFVRLFVYDKKQIEYLRRMKTHRGLRVWVNGRLSSRKSEYKGISYIQLTVIVRNIAIIKTTEK